MPERQEAELPEGAPGRVTATVAPRARADPAPPLHVDVLELQRTAGNRATARAIRSLQRQAVQTGYQWPTDPQTVNSPFLLRVLIGWLNVNPVTELDPDRYERAYDRSQVEPDPLGCMWKENVTTARAVADRSCRNPPRRGIRFAATMS